MTKNYDKWEARLQVLENEYGNLLMEQLKLIGNGEISGYLEGKQRAYLTVKQRKSSSVDRMEYLEKQIYQMREKLGVSTKGSVIEILEEFLKELERATDLFFADRAEKKRIARELLTKHWNC